MCQSMIVIVLGNERAASFLETTRSRANTPVRHTLKGSFQGSSDTRKPHYTIPLFYPGPWERVGKFDRRAAFVAANHYSRRKPGSPQFMPPGQTLILYRPGAVFGWWRPDPAAGITAMNGLDGWTCTIFRNDGSGVRSSELILAAELYLLAHAPGIGPDGLLSYVWDAKILSPNPGYCFKCAGWTVRGRSADNRKTLLWKDPQLAGVAP
jgi:hypothetical protein